MPIAMEQPKRPVGGAFTIFLTEKRPEYSKACLGQAACAVTKMGGEAWNKLSDKQKAPYQKKYAEAKEKYDKDLTAFFKAGGTLAARKSRKDRGDKGEKKKKDPDAPKKPVGGAYGIFVAENRAEFFKMVPAGSRATAISTIASKKWQALSDAAKKPFQEKYLKAQKAYLAAMEEYKKNLPAEAEEDEEEEEEEEDEEEDEEDEEPPSKKSRKMGA